MGRGQLCAARRHQHSGPVNGGTAVKYIGVALLIAAGFALLTLGLAFLLFRLAFGARKTTEKEMFVLPDTDQYRPYAAEARRMGKERLVHFLSGVSDAELKACYRDCDVFDRAASDDDADALFKR